MNAVFAWACKSDARMLVVLVLMWGGTVASLATVIGFFIALMAGLI